MAKAEIWLNRADGFNNKHFSSQKLLDASPTKATDKVVNTAINLYNYIADTHMVSKNPLKKS